MSWGSHLVDLLVTRRKPSTFVLLSCGFSLGASLALAAAAWACLGSEAIKSLANIVGYLGGLSFFVPSAIAMAVSSKKKRLAELIGQAGDAATRSKLTEVQTADDRFYDQYLEKGQIFHIIGLFLIALAFCLQI
jgi:hypothetical protein